MNFMLNPLEPRPFLEGHYFLVNSEGELKVAKIRSIATICNCTISKPLACALHCRIFI